MNRYTIMSANSADMYQFACDSLGAALNMLGDKTGELLSQIGPGAEPAYFIEASRGANEITVPVYRLG